VPSCRTYQLSAIKLRKKAPSPAGEGWGEENKKTCLIPLIPAFSLKGEGAKPLNLMVVTYSLQTL